MNQDWDIKPRSDECTGCQTLFEDKQHYFAALMFNEQGYERSDFCEKCWEKIAASHSSYSIWRGLYKKPPPKPEEPLKKESAESLLRRLMEYEDRSQINIIYILAVMLERKKVLVERDVQVRDDGVMVRIYEHRKTGETFVIADPRLQLDQLETVQEEVVVMLGGQPRSKDRPDSKEEPAGSDTGPDEAEDEKDNDDDEDDDDEEDDDDDDDDED